MLEMEEDAFLTIAYLYLFMNLLLRIFFTFLNLVMLSAFKTSSGFETSTFQKFWKYIFKSSMTFILTFLCKGILFYLFEFELLLFLSSTPYSCTEEFSQLHFVFVLATDTMSL